MQPSDSTTLRRQEIMFVDNVVLAGVVTVGLMVAFLGGFGYFIWQDAHKKR
jgi:nitrate reductase NapE component